MHTWSSQPSNNNMPSGNLLLSGAILYAGAMITQTLRVLQFMNIASISKSSYFRHQRDYLLPNVILDWQTEQEKLFKALNDMPPGLDIAGDARSDSPGHCAKYGSYTFIEQRLKKVVDLQLVQVRHCQTVHTCVQHNIEDKYDL